MTERAQCTAPLQYGNAVPAGGAGRRGREARTQGYGARGPAGARGRAGDGDAGGGCARERPQRRGGETRADGAHAGGERGGQGGEGGKEGGAEMETEDR